MNDADGAYRLRLSEPLERDRPAMLPTVAPRRPIVLVLGMHRSGTSLCSHILSVLGVDMADRIAPPGRASPLPENARGHWERWEIVGFHDRILALFNRAVSGPFHDFPLPAAWWADPRVVEIRREMAAFLENRMGEGHFGFKDPRTVRLMPVWHQLVSELSLAPKIVLCLRNPAQAARSLQARDGLDPELGEYRWLVHTIDFFRYAGTREFCAVEYEKWFEEPRSNIEKLKSFLDLPWQQSESDLDLVLSDIIDPALRHDPAQPREASRPLVRSLYRLATRAGHDAEVRRQISQIAAQFAGFQQLHEPFRRSFENLAGVAAKLPGIKAEVAGLRTVIGQRDAALTAAGEKLGGAEARLVEVLAQLEGTRAQLEDALKRAEEEVSGLRATIAERDAAVAAAEVKASAAEALAEIAAQRRPSAEDETALVEALQRGEELRERLEAMRAEMTASREARRHAERHAAERAGAVEAMRAEMATLREQITAARQVSRELAAAWATDFTRPAPGPRKAPRGWWWGTLRLLRFRAARHPSRPAQLAREMPATADD